MLFDRIFLYRSKCGVVTKVHNYEKVTPQKSFNIIEITIIIIHYHYHYHHHCQIRESLKDSSPDMVNIQV